VARILVVEDNALNIKLFCDLLAAHGHDPGAVTDSRAAREAARSGRRFLPRGGRPERRLRNAIQHAGTDLRSLSTEEDLVRAIAGFAALRRQHRR